MSQTADITTDVSNASRAVAVWLFACAGLVFVMVILGGVTRLTESGLSIVDWRPVTGMLPPLSEAEWQALFEKYKVSPEFKRANFWMTVADFKGIFWLEYLHRLLGRVIGVVFLIPLIYFWVRGRIGRRLVPHLMFLFILGCAQGLMGWYMVKSGLVDVPAVSQYRLAAHLGLAVVIYGYMLWLGLSLRVGAAAVPREAASAPGSSRRLAWIAWGWASLTLMSGAFVAGLDAGVTYNTFPLMDGKLVPDGMFSLSPWYANLFENAATVQFIHRTLAIGLVIYLVAIWLHGRRQGENRPFAWLALVGFVQGCLGVSTLLSGAEIILAALHQAGAMVVFSLALSAVFRARRQPLAGGGHSILDAESQPVYHSDRSW